MAALENTKAAVVTASGMAAISSTLLTLLKSGDHMLVQQSLYGGSEIFFTNDLPDWGITFTRVDADQPDTWAAAVKSSTKVTYLSGYHIGANPYHLHLQRWHSHTHMHSIRMSTNLTSIIPNTLHVSLAKLHAASSCHSAKQPWWYTFVTAEKLCPMLLTCCSFCHAAEAMVGPFNVKFCPSLFHLHPCTAGFLH